MEEKKNELIVKGFDGLVNQSQTKMNVFTNIEDTKKIYNLENHVDYKINDIKGEKIILFVGRIMEGKWIRHLLEAVTDIENIKAAARTGADRIELYTEPYAAQYHQALFS